MTTMPLKRTKMKNDYDAQEVKGEFDRLPLWLQNEYRALASILKYPQEFDENKNDLGPELFFDEQTLSMAEFIIAYHRENARWPDIQTLENHLRAQHGMDNAVVARSLRLLKYAPRFCPPNISDDFFGFVDKHRFCRGISGALETLPEQDLGWKHLQAYLFYIGDMLEHPSINRLLAPFAKSLLSRFSSCAPALLRKALGNEDMTDDLLAIETLRKIAEAQVSAWETGLNIPLAKCLDPKIVAALRKLQSLHLIHFRGDGNNNESGQFRVTSVAWKYLLFPQPPGAK
jgi:hypothetical protein